MTFFLVVFSIILIDQGTKLLAIRYLQGIRDLPVISGIFHLHYVENPGAAFGVLAYRTQFFILSTILVIGVILYYRRKIPNSRRLLHFSLALQMGGAIGNLIDRVVKGYVVDFFDFRVWPVFNIADSAITIGVIILCWEILRYGITLEEKNE